MESWQPSTSLAPSRHNNPGSSLIYSRREVQFRNFFRTTTAPWAQARKEALLNAPQQPDEDDRECGQTEVQPEWGPSEDGLGVGLAEIDGLLLQGGPGLSSGSIDECRFFGSAWFIHRKLFHRRLRISVRYRLFVLVHVTTVVKYSAFAGIVLPERRWRRQDELGGNEPKLDDLSGLDRHLAFDPDAINQGAVLGSGFPDDDFCAVNKEFTVSSRYGAVRDYQPALAAAADQIDSISQINGVQWTIVRGFENKFSHEIFLSSHLSHPPELDRRVRIGSPVSPMA